MSVYINPQYYKGPQPELVTMKAKSGISWLPGQFARNTATGIVLTTAVTGKAQYLTADLQVTDTTANQEVKLYKIPSAETKFLIYMTAANVDDVANPAIIGQTYGIAVNSCICTLAVPNTTYAFLRVENILPNVGSAGRSENDTDATPGVAIVSVLQSVLDSDAG
jgi:hypothetical protein